MEILKPSDIAGRNEKWSSYFRIQFGNFFKNFNINLLYNAAMLLLRIYPTRETKTYVNTKTHI
jgi:hypothetical protein